MKHAQSRKVLAGRVVELLGSLDDLSKKPRPYQVAAFEKLGSWFDNRKASRRGHVVHATGLGKTFLFSALLKHCHGLPSLVIVPTRVLLQQTAGKIALETDGRLGHLSSISKVVNDDGEVIAVRGHDHSNIVIATNASFVRYADRLANEFDPSLVVWDECHWAYTKRYQGALARFPEAVTLGFTATPDFLGSAAMGGYVPVQMDSGTTLYGNPKRFAGNNFGDEIDNLSVRWGIENRWLSPLAWGRIEFDVSLDSVPLTETDHGLDYDANSLQKLMAKHWDVMRDTVCRLYATSEYDLPERQSFAVCPGVEEAEDLAHAVKRLGISTACITSHTPDLERLEILKAYNRREIKLITSIMVLREGWDAPVAEVGMILRPTRSRVAYVQMMGRPLRPTTNGHKKVALILDAHFSQSKNDPLSAPVIFGEKEVTLGGILCGPKGGAAGGKNDGDSESPYLPKHAKPKLVVVDALQTLWHAKRDGTLVTPDGKLWANVHALRRILSLSGRTIMPRLMSGKVESIERAANKHGPFYLVEAAREACKDLITISVKANRDGVARFHGEKWAPSGVCARLLEMSSKTMAFRLKKVKVRWIWARNKLGRKFRFLSIKDVRTKCGGLKKDRSGLKQKKAGAVKYRGKLWATLEVCSKIFETDSKILTKLLGFHVVLTVRGTDTLGRGRTFYCVTDFKRIFETALVRDPDDPKGVFVAGGVEWITELKARAVLGLERRGGLQKRLKKYRGPHRVGISEKRQVLKLYRADIIRRLA